MAAIIGAFFAGMIFADYAGDWELLPRVHAITEFLGPFFFFSIGAQLNPRLFTGDVLITAIVITGLGGAFSVVSVNSWMNQPQGFSPTSGDVTKVEPLKVIFNPAVPSAGLYITMSPYTISGQDADRLDLRSDHVLLRGFSLAGGRARTA